VAVGTPVFGAPDGTAVIWRPPGAVGGGTRAVGAALRASEREVEGADVAAVDATGEGALRGAVVVGVALGALAGSSANAVPAPMPAITAVQARVVSKLRVRMRSLSSFDPEGIWWLWWCGITGRDDRDHDPVVKRWQRRRTGGKSVVGDRNPGGQLVPARLPEVEPPAAGEVEPLDGDLAAGRDHRLPGRCEILDLDDGASAGSCWNPRLTPPPQSTSV
jgi:hypothetical protein